MNQQGVLAQEIIKRSVPFADIQDFTPLIERIKNKKVVMLGESTHGTREFYEWRSLLTRELIQKHGFNFIAVEGDWPPCRFIDQFIRGMNGMGSFDALSHFSRWPTWMWGNAEIVSLMDWLRDWNHERKDQVGFHGLDLYSLFESIDVVIDHLSEINPKLARKTKNIYSCFEAYWGNERAYSRSLLSKPAGCEDKVLKALELIQASIIPDDERWFDAEQNARVVVNAEKYYRSMLTANEEAWNVRDNHMTQTLEFLMDRYGSGAKAIIWEHNSHIGDYRATDMRARGQINLGGLAREKWGRDQVALVGFTTYSGTVTASPAWDGPVKEMPLAPGKSGSIENVLHEAVPQVGNSDYYIMLEDVEQFSPLTDYCGHRAVGVVYRPEHEQTGNYVPSSVAERYDALVFFDKTTALTPLKLRPDPLKIPDTFPFGSQI